jgi:hypothetical protein
MIHEGLQMHLETVKDGANGQACHGPSTERTSGRWPLERVLFLLAGTMTGLSALLAALAAPVSR